MSNSAASLNYYDAYENESGYQKIKRRKNDKDLENKKKGNKRVKTNKW